MTPEETQQLKGHVNAIAQLLHADAQTQGMKMSTLDISKNSNNLPKRLSSFMGIKTSKHTLRKIKHFRYF
jgi:hypothetical protein